MKRPGWLPRTCAVCRASFMAHRHSQTTCSRLCRDRARVTARRAILERDSYTCSLCAVMAKRAARPLRPNHLAIIRVNPRRKPTAENLATACRRCVRVYEGTRLPPDREEKILTENRTLNELADIPNNRVMPDAETFRADE